MAYTRGTPFDSKEQEEQRQKKLKEIKEKMKETHGSCTRINDAFYQANYTCASINKDVCMPATCISSMSGSFKQTKTTGEKMFEQLAKENKKLTQEKIKLNLKVMQLEKQNYELIENYAKLKSFVEANKGQFWKDLINGIKGVFNNIVNWFNS